MACVKKIKKMARKYQFCSTELSFLHRPQKLSFSRETWRVNIKCLEVHQEFFS
jgi:hypothetical protein